MSAYTELIVACERLEYSMSCALIGAIASGISTELPHNWDARLKSPVQELCLLNAKSILVSASIGKNNYYVPTDSSEPSDASTDRAQLRLSQALDTRQCLNRSLHCLSISKMLRSLHRENKQDKILMMTEMLQKLSDLEAVLNNLKSQEKVLFQKVQQAKKEWLAATEIYKAPIPNLAPVEDNERLDSLINKMEVMRMLAGRLMASCGTYNWSLDSGKLLQILPTLRRAPFTAESFLKS